MLTCTDIHKAYGKNEVLRGISARFEPGTITSIIGPSGTGKSTFLRILSMLEAADRGDVTFEEHSVRYPLADREALAANPWPRLTTVFQQLFLWPHLTIRQNICLPVRATDKTRPGGMVDQIMGDLMVADFAERYPNEVSHGQRQRAAIARAIALEPQFMLLDEITSALDVEHVGIVLDYLQRLRDQGVGILLITHLIGFARDAADQVIFMEHGHIVEAGPASILSEPQTSRLRDFLSLVAHRSKSNGLLQSRYVVDAVRASLEKPAAITALDRSSSLRQLLSPTEAVPAPVIGQSLSDQEAEFVACALLEKLRSGELPSERDAATINRYPFVDGLRRKIEATDLSWILGAIDAGKPELAGLLISLLRNLSTRGEVIENLQRHWQSGTPSLKAHLLWRVLDRPGLPREQKQEILDFILEHWAVFNRVSSAFLGSAETIIPNALKRLADPSFPPEKKWAYLCRVIEPAADKQAAKALLSLHLNHEDEFMRHTARTLLDRFFPPSPQGETFKGEDRRAQRVIESLRSGQLPSEEEAVELDRQPVIDALRQLVEQADIDILTRPVGRVQPKLQGLFVSLLERHSSHPKVTSCFRELWATADTYVRTRLVFRLTDDPRLCEDWKRRLFDFVLSEPTAFEATCSAFYGGIAETREATFGRLADPRFPASKRWLYLCQLFVGQAQGGSWPMEQVARYLEVASHDSDAFTREAASRLRGLLDTPNQANN